MARRVEGAGQKLRSFAASYNKELVLFGVRGLAVGAGHVEMFARQEQQW